jgi:hypothetical protein
MNFTPYAPATITSLDTDPYQKIDLWIAEVKYLAKLLFREIKPGGLYACGALTLASEWNKLHPPQPDKDGKLQPVPFYSPDQPGDTETTSATNMTELGIKLSITARYSEAQRILDETVKTSIGPAMTSALRHPVNGWDGISTAQIYHAVTKKYLTLSIPQIRALKAELPLQFD